MRKNQILRKIREKLISVAFEGTDETVSFSPLVANSDEARIDDSH